jgi:hypothetical protein
MAETLLQYKHPIAGPDGRLYEARACGTPTDSGTWHGWIEFVPIDGGEPVHSPRETTQPNRTDTEYWATGLTPVYLEGSLRRALAPPPLMLSSPQRPSVFPGPAVRAVQVETVESVFNPFSVYEKGEALLRKQLAAFSAWHLVNIIQAYALGNEEVGTLNRRPAADLIEIIIAGVRDRRELTTRK